MENHLKQTPLYDIHLEHKAKMLAFGGWNMPIQYSGILDEHKNTRTHVSLFDVSHMGEFIVKGKDAAAFLQYVTTNNIEKLFDGKAQYSALLYDNGTFVDDIIIYQINKNEFQICVNASNIEKDFSWLQAHQKGFDIELKNISDKIALLALQGLKALQVMQKIVSEDLSSLGYYEFKKIKIQSHLCLVARMGYTGEDGFELFIPATSAIFFWKLLMQNGANENIQPAGLGARDTLRLEVGFSLYGNDIDDQHTPLEAGLSWIVSMEKDFIGKPALTAQKQKGLTQKLIAFQLTDKGVPRPHYAVYAENNTNTKIGEVTSGSISPMLNVGIGLAYVNIHNANLGATIFIDSRGNLMPAKIVKLPFYKK